MNLSKEEQRWSPLNKLLPRRTSRGGVCPGVTVDPDNEENWRFSTTVPTELEEIMIAATVVQIGILTMFNTHVYNITTGMGKHSFRRKAKYYLRCCKDSDE